MSVDLSAWLSKSEAAARLGISERTLDRLTDAGKGPERRNRQRPGKRPEPVFNPQDVETLAAAANPPMHIAADSPIRPNGNAPAGALVRSMEGEVPPGLALVLSILERLATIQRQPLTEASRASEKLWLTIKEAATYTGLSEAFLRRAVREGRLPHVRDRAVKVRRLDLANLDSVSTVAKSPGALPV